MTAKVPSMLELLLRLSPVMLAFGLGVACRHSGWLRPAHADTILKLMIRFGLPALILSAVSRLDIRPEIALLPLAAVVTVMTMLLPAWVQSRALAAARAQQGVMVIGVMIMNLAVVYPFAFAAWGSEGAGRLAFFDFGHTLLVMTLIYAIACWHGDGNGRIGMVLYRLLLFPPIWALTLALALNLFSLSLPAPLLQLLQGCGVLAIFLVVLALGVYFRWPRRVPPALFAVLLLRSGGGCLLGILWSGLLDLQGLDRAVVILGAAAPVGFNTLVFASRTGLDKSFAAALVSLSMLAALFYLPLVILLLGEQ